MVGVYREPADNGQMAIISLRSLRRIDHTAEPDTYMLRLSPNADLGLLRAYLKSRAGDSLTLAVVNTQISDLHQFRLTMLALSVTLSAIALISVFNSSVLNMRERISEVGTFKTLGMTPAQVVTMALASGGTLGVLAGVIGVPLGCSGAGALTAMGRCMALAHLICGPTGWRCSAGARRCGRGSIGKRRARPLGCAAQRRRSAAVRMTNVECRMSSGGCLWTRRCNLKAA